MYYNDPIGGSASPAQLLTIANVRQPATPGRIIVGQIGRKSRLSFGGYDLRGFDDGFGG